MMQNFRVTYGTLTSDDETVHRGFEQGVEVARDRLGKRRASIVAGAEDDGAAEFVGRSPNDSEILLGPFAPATGDLVGAAIDCARSGWRAWDARGWQERAQLLRRAADLVSERRDEFAALLTFEVGKTRLEALGEVEESADLIRYYCAAIEAHDGFDSPMQRLSPGECTASVLRPYGVWAVVSPFNFPMALSLGPAAAALVAGNAAMVKASPAASLSTLAATEILLEAGVPAEVCHVLLDGTGEIGRALCAHPGVDGVTFTGSHATGMTLLRDHAGAYPRPMICEMGGKNPVIVAANADVELAVAGIVRSAFSMSGQKCSACSRCYVEEPVAKQFVARLVEAAGEVEVRNPLDRGVFTGPVISLASVERFQDAVAEAAREGELLAGGGLCRDGELARGCYVEPTVARVPSSSRLWREELFAPFLAVQAVSGLDEAMRLADGTALGLTAGFYGQDEEEIERFLREIEAGVVYVNRRAGATTGAWPGVQPFGGWKGSGSTGKAGGGPHYLQLYMREQSRTIVVGEEVGG